MKRMVLVAELTGGNPNVLYEPGLAHALRKPVELVSSNDGDVPFHVRQVRVIYYEMKDPFWGKGTHREGGGKNRVGDPHEAILFEKPAG